MEKVYLLTCSSFSKFEGGVEYQITMCFDCDAEISVYQRKKDAFEHLLERVNISNSAGWVMSNGNDEVVEMVHDTFNWRKVYRITEKKLY